MMIFERNRQSPTKCSFSYGVKEFDQLQPKKVFFERGVISIGV